MEPQIAGKRNCRQAGAICIMIAALVIPQGCGMSLYRVCRAAALASFAATATWPDLACAFTQQGQQMMRNWVQADHCTAQAHKQFPDNSPQSLAKRDQALQQCLANSVLAPRAPQAQQQ
jgi:hypothetical protein